MTSRPRPPALLFAALLATAPALARAQSQDPPLYRDPSPTEGPRINGPILPPRPPTPSTTPPPPSTLGPFQGAPATPGPSPTGLALPPLPPAPEVPAEPLLGVPPGPPPQPALVALPGAFAATVQVKRSTSIQGPKGVLGRFHEWFRDACFGPPHPRAALAPPVQTFPESPQPEAPSSRFFNWPSWPSWPSMGR